MKYLLLSLLMILAVTANSQTPSPKKYKLEGNVITATSARQSISTHDSTTTYTYKDSNGKSFPVYKGKSGGLYVWITSKKGVPYKRYIKL